MAHEEKMRKKAIQALTMFSPPRFLGKLPISSCNIAIGRVIDFRFLAKECFTIWEKIARGWDFCVRLKSLFT